MATAASPSILITDDDLAFRETLRGMLEPRGFRTLLASDGEEALQIVLDQKEPIDLMLLDMHMPRLSGLETLRRVKEFRWRLPCILLSAALDEALVQQALSAQAFSVLPKPVTRLTITLTVEQALGRLPDASGQGGLAADGGKIPGALQGRCATPHFGQFPGRPGPS